MTFGATVNLHSFCLRTHCRGQPGRSAPAYGTVVVRAGRRPSPPGDEHNIHKTKLGPDVIASRKDVKEHVEWHGATVISNAVRRRCLHVVVQCSLHNVLSLAVVSFIDIVSKMLCNP